MRYETVSINQAEGIILCSAFDFAEKSYTKGHQITAEDIPYFKKYNVNSVYGCFFEEGDVEYKTALKQIAAQICGENIGYKVDEDGICRFNALHDGVFMIEEMRIDKFNSFNKNIVLNTIAPHSVVKLGDALAELEIVPSLIREDEVDEMIFKLSGNDNLLSVSEIKPRQAILVYPHLLNDESENQHMTAVVMKLITDLDGLGLNFNREMNSRYEVEILTDTLFDACAKAEVVFVLNPVKASGEQDVVTKAVKKTVDEIYNDSLPLIGASDLLIARKGKTTVIVLPFAYDKVESTTINALIKQSVFTQYLNEAVFSHKKAGRLFLGKSLDEKDVEKLIAPKNNKSKNQIANIGIVVLAAGQGRRSGTNKLLAMDKQEKPLFLRAVEAAIGSKAKPVFVITGYRHEEMEEYLEKFDVNVLYNPSYAFGIKTSINMGLKAIPASCDGAILLPADMPYITASDLDKLISKFDKTKEKQLCLFENKGIKNNPLLWSRSLYEKADVVPENAAFRVVFAEHSDYTNVVEIKDSKKLTDINFPNDVLEFCNH